MSIRKAELGGVYVRKLAPARVSHWDDFLISYVDKIYVGSKSQTLGMRYPFQSTGRPTSYRNGWSFRVYMITLRDFVPE